MFAQEGAEDKEGVENIGNFDEDRVGALEVTVESVEVWGRAGDLNQIRGLLGPLRMRDW